MNITTLQPGQVTLRQLEAIYRESFPLELSADCRAGVEASHHLVQQAVERGEPVYGINTGFGKLASVRIPANQTAQLQRNLVLSHCCGIGAACESSIVRLMMVLKLLSLGRGASGVRWSLVELLTEMLNRGVIPVIPSQGSVGASGDLAPLAHLTAVMIGEGEADYRGRRLGGADALQAAGLTPLILGAKEGLAMINGTQFSTAQGLVGLFRAWRGVQNSVLASCLTTDAIMGSTAPLHAEIHNLRGHRGQIEVAAAMRRLMEGSEIRESHRQGDQRVQDPYCIRCQPQVVGAVVDLLRQAGQTLRIEANAVTDNPLVLPLSPTVEEDLIVSGGNFHAEPVAFAADLIALGIAETGAISQRRIALMVDPTLSFDLPPFLTPEPGLNSGLMIAEVASAALMSENKHLANPCSTDSTPTSANQEDHVSMSAHGAVRLGRMNDNLNRIIGIEFLCAAQGIEFRAPLTTSPRLQTILSAIRGQVPTLTQDRFLAHDLERAGEMVADPGLIDLADLNQDLALES